MEVLSVVKQVALAIISTREFWYVPSVVALERGNQGCQLVAVNWVGGIFTKPQEAGEAAIGKAKVLMSDCWHFEEEKVAKWLPVCHIGSLTLEPPFVNRHLIYMRVLEWRSGELSKVITNHLESAY